MKKIFAILMVALIAMVVVFADPVAANDQAQIKVNAEIKIQYPVYSLEAASFGTYGAGTNAVIDVTDEMVHSALTAEDIRIGDDVLTEHDATVNFVINQTTLSRIKGTYALSVAAENLVIDQITKTDGTKVDATAAEKTANFFAVSAAPSITPGTVSNATITAPSAGTLSVVYNGKKVAADSVLGTFSYTWTHNDECAAGDYIANVTLTITSVV